MGKVKRKNKIRRNLILRALLDHKSLSITGLKNKTGISLPVVSSIVGNLQEKGYIIEVEDTETRKAGRPPSIYELNGEAGYVLGVDIGRVNSNFVIIDLAQNIVKSVRRKSVDVNSSNLETVDKLYDELNSVLEDTKVDWDRILGVGFSIPGIVQGPQGITRTYFNFEDRTIKEILEEKLDKPVHIEHDAKAMALGERWFGDARDKDNVICINLGWGIGSGIIIDGKLYYGSDYYAGEFGHLQVVPNGNLCYCGKRGCLETYASGKAIANTAREKIKNGAQTILTDAAGNNIDNIDTKMIVEASKKGDQFAFEILEEAAGYIGRALAQMINILNPELIIFGGKIATAKSSIINLVVSSTMKYSMTHINDNLEFTTSQLGTNAGALGVAMLEAQKLFEVEHLNPQAHV